MIFEDDAAPLRRLALENDMLTAATAFDTIGSALYHLRQDIRSLHEAYSKEELIAEIGAAALVNVAGLETAKSFRNTAAYIQNWLSVLKNDKRFIVSASGKAEKAVNLILGTAA